MNFTRPNVGFVPLSRQLTMGVCSEMLGSASPQAVRKLLSLSETGKTRPHQPRHPPPSPSPGAPRRITGVGVNTHERSHSDTSGGVLPHFHPPPLLSSVDLNAESSSVTSLSNLPLRKTLTSGTMHAYVINPRCQQVETNALECYRPRRL